MFRFFHAADLHLDSPLRGLDRYESAPVDEVRGATRRALANLVRAAVAEPVAFVLIAGDIYDGEWKDYSTGLYFASEMKRLEAAGIRVFLISGNHDAASIISRSLPLPSNVHVFPVDAPDTVTLEVDGTTVAIHGQGFARREVTEDLAARYPTPVEGAFNIGLLHTSCGGAAGHAPYAPCSPSDLAAKGYDYWALGHVHERAVLSESPWIVFSGNIQGRHVRETGAKGATIVTVDGGRVADVEHRELDVLRWARIEVDAAPDDGGDELLDAAAAAVGDEIDRADGRPLAVRVEFRGRTRAHFAVARHEARLEEELRARLPLGAWLQRVQIGTAPYVDIDELARSDEVLGELVEHCAEISGDPRLAAEILEVATSDLKRDVRDFLLRDAKDEDGLHDDGGADLARRLVAEARDLLLARLGEVAESP